MGEETAIGWADSTFNPWWGCERVSPACAHCYADTFARRIGMADLWANGGSHAFRFFGDKHWDDPLKWARTLPEELGRRPRVFCASMADVFEDHPDLEEHRLRLFALIVATPELDWLILTKRPEFARDWLRRFYVENRPLQMRDASGSLWVHEPSNREWTSRDGIEWGALPNVWMGVSIENARYTWRADVLREIPAAVRFISAEPLLGSLFNDSSRKRAASQPAERGRARLHAGGGRDAQEPGMGARTRAPLDLTGIDWVIIGGESGPGSRPFHLEHAREIMRRCDPYEPVCCGNRDAEECCNEPVPRGQVEPVPAVFVKQLGAKPVESGERYAAQVAIPIECRHGYDVCPECDAADVAMKLRDRKGEDWDEWPADLRIREFPYREVQVAA